jgi:hypothetical protein
MLEILWKVGGRELPPQPKETREQVLRRRGTLISLKVVDILPATAHESLRGQPQVLCVMPYMADI